MVASHLIVLVVVSTLATTWRSYPLGTIQSNYRQFNTFPDLPTINKLVQEAIDQDQIPGAVVMIGQRSSFLRLLIWAHWVYGNLLVD